MDYSLNRRDNHRSCLFASFLFAMTIFGTAAAKADDQPAFVAFGSVWRVYDIYWAEFEKQWLIGAKVSAVTPVGRQLTGPQMLAEFCKKILFVKPNAPDKLAERDMIFRVDLSIIGANKRPIWPLPIPIRVRSGECQVREGGQQFHMTYPGGLEGWRFHSATLQKFGEMYRRQHTFEPVEGANVTIQDFDFDLGCRATLNDPTVQSFQANIEQQNANIAVEPDTVVIIAKQGAKQGLFFGHVYKIADGNCVKQ